MSTETTKSTPAERLEKAKARFNAATSLVGCAVTPADRHLAFREQMRAMDELNAAADAVAAEQ